MRYPHHLQKLIENLKRLPGVGAKSAERFAFQMLNWKENQLSEFADLVKNLPQELKSCVDCGCLQDLNNCKFCDPVRIQSGLLCVISTPKDAFAIEQTREYAGLYHVLGFLLSPLEGKGVAQLNLAPLRARIQKLKVKELILALDSTLEGDATALYLRREFGDLNLLISRLAFGIPLGSSFDYVDGGTLARSLSGRALFS